LIDGGANPAPLVSQVATDVVIEKAKARGLGIVGVRNIFSSNGAQAFYAERMANEGLIGVALARSPASFAPFDSIDPLFGTNPIGFGFPTNGEPLVFDMATSAMTWYGLVLAKARGEKIPEKIAIDKNGNQTTDPTQAMDGALLPFDGGYKGSGLGMIVEILGGPLVGAAYAQLEGEWGALFLAIDPNILVDSENFKASCSDLIRKVKGSRKRTGITEIRLPGERALMARNEAERTGFVEVDDSILKELNFM
jgi:LDH2 family malate/lactate/ureidoglycolate dehydrogenase